MIVKTQFKNVEQTQLVKQISELMPVDGVVPTSVPGLTLMRASQPSERQSIIYEPCIYVVAQGCKRAYLDSEVFSYDALHFLVLTVPLPMQAHVVTASEEKPYLAMRVNINLEQLNHLLIEMGESTEPNTDNSNQGVFVSTINRELIEGMSRLIRLHNNRPRGKVLAQGIIKEILYDVLCGEQGPLLKSFALSYRHNHQIATVIHYIQKNHHKTIDVAELAGVANMSASSFHHHFKTVTRSSPVQYIKSIRLHRAKRFIQDDAQSVSEAAFKVGYSSISQFSREYKRLFGVVPSRELVS